MFNLLPKDEEPVVRGLCEHIFNMGYTVIIDNGEYLVRCGDMGAIDDEIFACDEEVFLIWSNDDRKSLGSFSLMYNNGSEGDGMIVIQDYSDNELCNAIYNELDDEFGDC